MPITTNLAFTADLDRGVTLQHLKAALLTGDSQAHRITVACNRSGKPASLINAAVAGYFVRSDGSTIVISGKLQDHTAVLTLPQACYTTPGRFSLVVKLCYHDVADAILWLEGSVSTSQTETLTVPEETLFTLDMLLGKIAALENAMLQARLALAEVDLLAPAITETAKGRILSLADASARTFSSLRLYGRTTQGGVPAPNAPVAPVGLGRSGTLSLTITGHDSADAQTVESGIPPLHGFRVESGGNFTDESGQMWLADYVDARTATAMTLIPVEHFISGSKPTAAGNSGKAFQLPLSVPAIATQDTDDPSAVLFCSTLPPIPRAKVLAGEQGAALQGDKLILCVEGITTASAMADWLADHPTTVVYRPLVPLYRTQNLDNAEAWQALHSCKPFTYITNNCDAWMEATYTADTRAYVLAHGGQHGGSGGYTPIRGIDYWTSADQESIVQQVLTALGTPVFGSVDANNVITLTGELAVGVYTLVYEDAEGNRNQIGTLDFSQDGAMVIPWLDGYSCGGSSGTVNEVNAEYMTTEKIPLEEGYEYTLSIGKNNGSWSLFAYYYTEDNAALGRNETESFQTGTVHDGKSVVLSPKDGAVDFKLQSYCGAHMYDTVKANVTLTKRYVG